MLNPVPGGARLRRAAFLMLVALASVPAAAAAAPRSAADAQGGVPDGTIALPRDPADVDFGDAVGSFDARIRAERAEARAAAKSLDKARARLDAADVALAEAEHRVDALMSRAGAQASPGFFSPRSEHGGRAAGDRGRETADPSPPALPLTLTIDAATVERFAEARDQVTAEAERRANAQAETIAQARRAEAARSAADAAATRKAEFLDEAQQRLAEALEDATSAGDAARQAEVKARRDELVAIIEAPKRAAARKAQADATAKAEAQAEAEAAARAEAVAAAMTPWPIGLPTGAHPSVPCPGGGSITVDGSLAHNLNAMLLVAWRDNFNLCGGGYRDSGQQVQLRIQNCGTSDYAIYQMPSGSCSPPTAIPGTSLHERGLAIDFRCAGRGMPSRSSPCFAWMAGHAAAFGFYNLPSEPWHWSVDGS
jgi:D-alanyl-D-alanine carboxypeptidase